MSMIRFEKTERTVKFLNPLRNFEMESHALEVRRDPLLGTTSVYNPNLKDKAKAFFGENDPELLKRLVEESEKACIFCGDQPEKGSPKYPAELLPEGRIKEGEAILFANLFPLAQYHPVVSLCKAHFLRLAEFSPGLLCNGFRASLSFLRAVYAHDSGAVYASVNANYLYPAGASLVHPHLQMLVSPVAYSFQARLEEAARAYYEKTRSSYFTDLAAEEQKRAERYIAQKGNWHWLSAFSPGGTNEIIAIHDHAADFGMLSDEDLRDLSSGVSKTLAYYEALGHLSFNYSLYSKKAGEKDGLRCLFRIITRQNLYANYRNDDYFLQKMLNAELIITPPEELAEKARGFLDRW
jgi:galactose-1-phosphate uridylyltransferase